MADRVPGRTLFELCTHCGGDGTMLIDRTESGDTRQTRVEAFCDHCGGGGFEPGQASNFDPNSKLPSGMTVGEAVQRSAAWWDRTGRFLLAKHKNQQRSVKTTTAGGGPAMSRAELADVIPSGILRGARWDDLDNREKLNVVRTWHHHHVASVDLEPARRHLADHIRDQRLGIQEKDLHGQRAEGIRQQLRKDQGK